MYNNNNTTTDFLIVIARRHMVSTLSRMLLVAIFCSSASALRLLGRRAAMGSAALALSSPLSASAKKNTADYASGFVESKSLATLKAEALADVYEPFESALRKDAPAMSKVYTADATIIAGTGSKGLITIGSSDVCAAESRSRDL